MIAQVQFVIHFWQIDHILSLIDAINLYAGQSKICILINVAEFVIRVYMYMQNDAIEW